MREPGAVKVPSHNIALVVDSVCLRVRGTRIIDGGEHSVFVEEEAMEVKRVIVETYDISGSIDRVRKRVGRAWEIYRGEAVSAAEEAVLRYAIQIIFADNVAAGIDSPARCVHSPGHIKESKRSLREYKAMRRRPIVTVEADEISTGIDPLTGGEGGAWDVDGYEVLPNPALQRATCISPSASKTKTEITKPIFGNNRLFIFFSFNYFVNCEVVIFSFVCLQLR